MEKGGFSKIQLDLNYLILGDFGAAAVIISFGAILGKCSLFQLWVLATIEMVFYTLNEEIAT
jgi:ammonium transporter Rh